MSAGRVETFSDGVMSIIITIMAFGIPLPEAFDSESLLNLLSGVGIFFVSFVVVGAQWIKHHYLFQFCREISGRVLWCNILYLFFLSLVPLFTRWIMENPRESMPAMGYDMVFFMLTFCYHTLQKALIKENNSDLLEKIRERRNNKYDKIFFAVILLVMLSIFVLSFFFPTVSIVCFVALPVITSLANLRREEKDYLRARFCHTFNECVKENQGILVLNENNDS